MTPKPVPAVTEPGALTLSEVAAAEETAACNALITLTEPEVAASVTLSSAYVKRDVDDGSAVDF